MENEQQKVETANRKVENETAAKIGNCLEMLIFKYGLV
jgi:hypothetical protein